MKAGQSPIFEPGLSEIMQDAIQNGKINFTTDLAAGVNYGDILFKTSRGVNWDDKITNIVIGIPTLILMFNRRKHAG